MKKLLIFTLFSFLVSFDTFEYSIGLNDKLIYTGLVSKSWIKVEDNRETYIILGNSFLLSGAIGYGKKYSFFRNSFISPRLWTTFLAIFLNNSVYRLYSEILPQFALHLKIPKKINSRYYTTHFFVFTCETIKLIDKFN